MRRVMAIVGCAGGLMLTATAWADGGPVPAIQGGPGVSTPESNVGYVALGLPGGTLVERVRRTNGAVDGWRLTPGHLGVPGVGFDGSTTGLSADGRRLVLAEITNRYPPRRTRLVVLDARRLRVLERLSLPGFFTVDAISPTGRWLYLIHYTATSNLPSYEVRAYDMLARRLLQRPVVDPREPDEAMRGIAATRVTSNDGRWVYTLYLRPDAAAFVHALDTRRRTAACIDLPSLTVTDPSALHLSLSKRAHTLRVLTTGGPQALIDTRTFAMVRPLATTPSPPGGRAGPLRANAPPDGDGDGPPTWPIAAVVLTVLAALAGIARAHQRRVASA